MSSLTLPPDTETPGQDDWAEQCSTAQLKEIVAIGVAAGDRFDRAAREIERRSSERRHVVEAQDEDIKRRKARHERTIILVVLGAAALGLGLTAILP